MRDYFAKYLPVEGEIKEGKLFKANHNTNIGVITAIKQGKIEKIIHYGNNWFTIEPLGKIVKLFLCSRDIQVGDQCWTTVGGCYSKFTEKCDPKYWFKVIGEVSPEAIWIKEGDEFDEDDIAYRFSNNGEDIILQPLAFPEDEVTDWGKPSYIVIKCPTCKTYH